MEPTLSILNRIRSGRDLIHALDPKTGHVLSDLYRWEVGLLVLLYVCSVTGRQRLIDVSQIHQTVLVKLSCVEVNQLVALTAKFEVLFRVILERLSDQWSINHDIGKPYGLVSDDTVSELLSYAVAVLKAEQVNRRALDVHLATVLEKIGWAPHGSRFTIGYTVWGR